ncbi:MAG: hypothetical protein KC657_16430 [Myxococcales bacterium]|nr:hypothetical protein [Myxococcales bacterium]
MHGIHVATAVLVLVAGCSSPAPPDGAGSGDSTTTGARGASSSGEGSSGQAAGSSGGGGAGAGASSSGGGAGAACANAGIWSGPVEGTYVDLLKPDKRLPVTGTATVKLTSGSGKFQIDADSGIEIVLKDILGAGRDATVKRPLTGDSTCETLTAQGNGDTGILKVNVTADCKFAGDKCQGAWTAVTPGKNGEADTEVANGTFSIAKKE